MRKTMMEDLTKTTAELEEVCDRLDAEIARLDILHDLMVNALARLQRQMKGENQNERDV